MVIDMSEHEKTDRLTQVLNAYGADPARWPGEEREALLREARSGDVEAELRDAGEIDAVLNAAPLLKMPAGALERMMDAVETSENDADIVNLEDFRKTRKQRILREIVPTITAIAACLVLGVLIGTSQLAEQYLPVGTNVATNNSISQDGTLLDLEDGSYEDGDVL
jgi:hypothetical protein